MSRRKYREAAKAKRTILLDGLTESDRAFMDADRERQKYDPDVQQQKLHDQIEHQQRMLMILRGASI